MATSYKKCKVCGKEYKACRSLATGATAFHWKTVACSPEHGEQYLRMIEESRKPKDKVVEKPVVKKKEPKKPKEDVAEPVVEEKKEPETEVTPVGTANSVAAFLNSTGN